MKPLQSAWIAMWLAIVVIETRPHACLLPQGDVELLTTDWHGPKLEEPEGEEETKGDDPKAASQWQALTPRQRREWSAWAKSNPVLLDDGSFQRVSGRKAMMMVLRNRALAGDAANPARVPAPVAWLNNPLSLRDAGPFTENTGFVGFRAEQRLAAGLKWFVWATPPVDGSISDVQCRLRFVKCMTPGALAYDDLTPTLGSDYEAVNGPWTGPGLEGEWPVDTFIWFRVHQYADGQLGPGVTMRGRIQVEL